MKYIKKLQSIGLKKQEAEIYLACLELEMAKVADLIRKVDIPRTSIYVYLNNLLNKGYIKKTKKEGVQYFIALEPKYILEDAQEKVSDFSNILPQLERLIGLPKKKTKIEYFDTVEGIKKMYKMMLEIEYNHIPYLIESSEATKQAMEKVGYNFMLKWQKKFLGKKVVTQGIITSDTVPVLKTMPMNIKKIASQRPATVRVIDEKEFPFSINLYLIYPNLSFVIVPQENLVIKIENEDIYNSLVVLYQLLFDRGDLFDVKNIIM